jgi:hypothetical protein
MATLAVIEQDGNGGFSVRPAVQADIDAVVTPRVDAQMASEITACEQRTWQRMLDADTATAVNVETSVFGKVKAALQAALAYLGG